MENDTFGGAILAWVKSTKAFLKVQAGTGDNLLEEDIREGFSEFFSETFERLVSIALARLDFDRRNLEILPLRRF